MTLSEAKTNKTYKVTAVSGEVTAHLRRLLELGMVVGAKVKVVGKSIQNKVFLIEIRGCLFSVRRLGLECLQVEEC